MISERDALRLWLKLFRGQAITALTFQEADSVLEELPETSPLRFRLALELNEHRERAASRE